MRNRPEKRGPESAEKPGRRAYLQPIDTNAILDTEGALQNAIFALPFRASGYAGVGIRPFYEEKRIATPASRVRNDGGRAFCNAPLLSVLSGGHDRLAVLSTTRSSPVWQTRNSTSGRSHRGLFGMSSLPGESKTVSSIRLPFM